MYIDSGLGSGTPIAPDKDLDMELSNIVVSDFGLGAAVGSGSGAAVGSSSGSGAAVGIGLGSGAALRQCSLWLCGTLCGSGRFYRTSCGSGRLCSARCCGGSMHALCWVHCCGSSAQSSLLLPRRGDLLLLIPSKKFRSALSAYSGISVFNCSLSSSGSLRQGCCCRHKILSHWLAGPLSLDSMHLVHSSLFGLGSNKQLCIIFTLCEKSTWCIHLPNHRELESPEATF